MMESSEKNHADGSLPLDNSSFANSENSAREVLHERKEEVLGYLDKEKATLVLGSERIELDGRRIIFAHGPGNELLVYMSAEQEPSVDYALLQSISENPDNNHTLATQCGLNNLEAFSNEDIQVIEKNDCSENNDKNGTLHIQQAQVDSYYNHSSPEPFGYDVQEEDDTTEMIFIPLSNSFDFLNLPGVLHPTIVTSKLHGKEEIECLRKKSDGSVVNKMHADSYSSKVENVGVSAVNKEGNNNSLQDEHKASEMETSSPSVEDCPSMLYMPPQNIGNTVSAVHIATPTLVHDLYCEVKNIQKDKIETEETGQSNITFPSADVNFVESSNLNNSLNSELFSESHLIRDSSKHFDLKCSTESSNKYDNANSETSVIEETMDQDTNESIHFSPLLPSNENIIGNDSKRKNAIDCNYIDSNISVDQNLDNKISYLSSKNYENEMNFINSEEACSEIQTGIERALSLGDNSETKGSFFSDNSKPKYRNQHIVKKMKSAGPSEVKVIDEYDFVNNSSNIHQESGHNSSLNWQTSDDTSIEVDANEVSQSIDSDLEGVTGNLTFQYVLNPITNITKLNENLVDGKNSETYYDNSQYLCNQIPLHKEEHSSTKILKRPNVKLCEHKQNSVLGEVNHTDDDRKSDENIPAFKNADIDNKSKENDSTFLNIAASDETSVKPPQRTYGRKKKNF